MRRAAVLLWCYLTMMPTSQIIPIANYWTTPTGRAPYTTDLVSCCDYTTLLPYYYYCIVVLAAFVSVAACLCTGRY